MTAKEAARVLMRWRWSHAKIVVDEFAPEGWSKGDVMEISQAGFLTEWEIKLSRSDYGRDRSKLLVGRDGISFPKHQLLAEHDPRGPCRFYFTVPFGLLCDEPIPQWAGLVQVMNRGAGVPLAERYRPIVTKVAPALHDCRVSMAVESSALRAAHSRMHALIAGDLG